MKRSAVMAAWKPFGRIKPTFERSNDAGTCDLMCSGLHPSKEPYMVSISKVPRLCPLLMAVVFSVLGCGDSNSDGLGDRENKVRAVSAGNNYTCAILWSGALKCWGQRDEGALGLGDTDRHGDDPGEM